MKKKAKGSLGSRLAKIKALALDCDGILSDTIIYYMGSGQWSRSYSIRDGYGIKKMLDAGYKVTVITNSRSEDISERMKTLKIPKWFDGVTDKNHAWEQFLSENNLSASEVAYMGDDEPDLPLLARAGVAFTVSDAMADVKKAADYVAKRPAGNGAVREVIELILQASKKPAKGK